MRVEDFKSVIAEFLNNDLPPTVGREISLPTDVNYIVTLTGGRRAGKTYLLFHTIRKLLEEKKASKDEIIYVDFEHP
ncbi:hypothetical protein SJAV_01660 [Sulfurisphaera javensis]|uniref:AAA domain-containing protein n=1 Tax=Sulfurisphaera javensis TaxID=2049879 RepID=A0AAT9GMV2_9CREN